MPYCVICKSVLNNFTEESDFYSYNCPRCGKFSIVGSIKDTMLPNWLERGKDNASLLSHLLRKMQTASEIPTLDSKLLSKLITTRSLPKPAEQARNFLLWLGENVPSYHAEMEVKAEIQSVIGAQTPQGVYYVTSHLMDQGYIRSGGIGSAYSITFEGWEEIERLRTQVADSRVAFMAMQFGDIELNRLVNDVFRPAVEATGFELRVLTDSPRAGLIDDRLRVEIRNAKFLLADLTHRNPGAYWEAGLAEGLGKPVIYTCKANEFQKVVHFDTNHHLTVMWDIADLEEAAAMLKATIRATLPDEAKMND